MRADDPKVGSAAAKPLANSAFPVLHDLHTLLPSANKAWWLYKLATTCKAGCKHQPYEHLQHPFTMHALRRHYIPTQIFDDFVLY